jgi:hypothetical protein
MRLWPLVSDARPHGKRLMRRTAFLALFAVSAFAQDTTDLFNRAPKPIDDALRARISEFYTAHVNAKFREAEHMVAEDSKDYFYNHDKPQYMGFEIVRIEYSDGYTRAKATVAVEQRVMFPGFNGRVMKIPTPSYWKTEDGKWVWYVDMAKLNETPFGVMKPGPPSKDDQSPAAVMASLPTNEEELMNLVRTDKTAVKLSVGGSERVEVANGLKGPVTFTIQGKLAGIEASFDRDVVPPGEKATLTIKAGPLAKSGTLTVRAAPLGKLIQVQVTVN